MPERQRVEVEITWSVKTLKMVAFPEQGCWYGDGGDWLAWAPMYEPGKGPEVPTDEEIGEVDFFAISEEEGKAAREAWAELKGWPTYAKAREQIDQQMRDWRAGGPAPTLGTEAIIKIQGDEIIRLETELRQATARVTELQENQVINLHNSRLAIKAADCYIEITGPENTVSMSPAAT